MGRRHDIKNLEKMLKAVKKTNEGTSFIRGVQLYLAKYGPDEDIARVRSGYVDYIAKKLYGGNK